MKTNKIINHGIINIYNVPATKMELTPAEEKREIATLRKMDKDRIVTDYIENHEITYLAQVTMENVLAYSNVVLIHEITKELEMKSMANIMVSKLEALGYPAGRKLEGLRIEGRFDVTKIGVYTNSPVSVYHRAVAAVKKAQASLDGNHIRSIDMSALIKNFSKVAKIGAEILINKESLAEKHRDLAADLVFAPYAEMKEMLANGTDSELIEFFKDKRPA